MTTASIRDDLMVDLVAFVNERLDLSPTVIAALAHAQSSRSIHFMMATDE